MPRFIRWHVQEISGNLGMTSPISDRLGLAGYGWIWLDVEYRVVFLPVSTARWRKVERTKGPKNCHPRLIWFISLLFVSFCNPMQSGRSDNLTTFQQPPTMERIEHECISCLGEVSVVMSVYRRVEWFFQHMSIEDTLTKMKDKPKCKSVQNSIKRMVDRKAVVGQACRIGFLFKDVSTPAQFHCVIWCWGLSLELERCKSLRHWFERGHVLLGPAP